MQNCEKCGAPSQIALGDKVLEIYICSDRNCDWEKTPNISFIPRLLVFGSDGKCKAAGVSAHHYHNVEGYVNSVMELPTDHYNFVGFVDPLGLDRGEIEMACSHYR